MKSYAEAIEETVSGRTAASYSSYRSMYDSVSAAMIAYIFEIDISIVYSDINNAKEASELAKKAARKLNHQIHNEERRLVNLARRHSDDKSRATD